MSNRGSNALASTESEATNIFAYSVEAKSYAVCRDLHRASLDRLLKFWVYVLANDVLDMETLSNSQHQVLSSIRVATDAFLDLVAHHKSPTAYRAFASFLQSVRNDILLSKEMFQTAARLEEENMKKHTQSILSQGYAKTGSTVAGGSATTTPAPGQAFSLPRQKHHSPHLHILSLCFIIQELQLLIANQLVEFQ